MPLTTSTIWQCVLFLPHCIKSFPVYHWKRVLVLGPGFWVHLSERAANCFGFLDVGGTFDRKDFLTVTLERCKIVLPLYTRVSFNQSTSIFWQPFQVGKQWKTFQIFIAITAFWFALCLVVGICSRKQPTNLAPKLTVFGCWEYHITLPQFSPKEMVVIHISAKYEENPSQNS